MENLLRNAEEHTNGPVTVSVGWLESDESITGFYVEDDGPGIPREDGTGLGLAIVRQIVLAHGWSIRVTESRSGGAPFEVTGVDPIHDSTDEVDPSRAEVEEDD